MAKYNIFELLVTVSTYHNMEMKVPWGMMQHNKLRRSPRSSDPTAFVNDFEVEWQNHLKITRRWLARIFRQQLAYIFRRKLFECSNLWPNALCLKLFKSSTRLSVSSCWCLESMQEVTNNYFQVFRSHLYIVICEFYNPRFIPCSMAQYSNLFRHTKLRSFSILIVCLLICYWIESNFLRRKSYHEITSDAMVWLAGIPSYIGLIQSHIAVEQPTEKVVIFSPHHVKTSNNYRPPQKNVC